MQPQTSPTQTPGPGQDDPRKEPALAGDPGFKVLITAHEAYPELERCFLEAREVIRAGFRVFDLETGLRSARAREIGEDWFDLVVHTLRRGVALHIMVSDFDPVARPSLHFCSWRTYRMLIAAAEAAGRPDLLHAVPAMHPARVGLLPRLPLWPRILRELRCLADELNEAAPEDRARRLEHMPGVRRWLCEDGAGKLRPRRWPVPPLVPASHHQKIAVFDRERLYIGGLDLDERRFDTPRHDQPGAETWHDVQLLVEEGSAPRAADDYMRTVLDCLARGRRLDHGPEFLNTLSTRRSNRLLFLAPRTVNSGIAAAHETCAAQAKRLIYLESQFFRDRRLARRLARAAQANPGLQLILVLPAAPEDVAFEHNKKSDARYGEYLQARSIAILRKGFGPGRLLIATPAQRRTGGGGGRASTHDSPLIYVHAKVSVFDESCAIVSSANLNGRSLRWDTEAGLRLTDPARVMHLRDRCFRHWLGADAGPEFYATDTAFEHWKAMVRANGRADPDDRLGFLVPYRVTPARRFGKNLPVIPDEMV